MTEAVRKINKYLKDNQRSKIWLSKQIGVSRQMVTLWLNEGNIPTHVNRLKLKKLIPGLKDDWV